MRHWRRACTIEPGDLVAHPAGWLSVVDVLVIPGGVQLVYADGTTTTHDTWAPVLLDS